MKCTALKDGLVDKTKYVHAGEIFEAAKCPSWAKPLKVSGKKSDGAASPSEDGKDDE
jgi:hypothetical protein